MGCHAGPGLISATLWVPTQEAQAIAATGRKSTRRAMQSTLCSSLIFSKKAKACGVPFGIARLQYEGFFDV
jgi:hypothetical protein